MKRTTVLLVGILAVTMAAPGAEAGKGRHHRTATAPYENPNGVMAADTAAIIADGIVSEATFETKRGERFVTATIVDDTGQTVLASLYQDVDGDGNTEVNEDICGQTTAPIAIKSGAPIVVQVFEGACDGPSPAIATTGTITLHFTSRR